MHGFLEFPRIVRADDVALGIEEVAVPFLSEDGTEIPAVAMVIGELRVLELRIELRDPFQEFHVPPLASNRRPFRVPRVDSAHLGRGGVALFFRPHEWGIGFVVPHRVAKVGI